MTVNLESVMGRRDEVLSLLNKAYDGWGDEVYFNWKYNEYPDYKPDEHTFALFTGDDLCAFRRVFEKEIRYGGESHTVFVLGDTAVSPQHQGQGYYSTLHEKTTEFCRDKGASAVITFNNIDNITFDANLKRGWTYEVLPLRLYVHSYEEVLSKYAERALSTESVVTSFVSTLGERFELTINGESVPVSRIFDSQPPDDKWRFGVQASPKAVARFVETVSNGSIMQTIPMGVRQLISGEMTLTGRPNQITKMRHDNQIDIVDPSQLSNLDQQRIVELRHASWAGRPAFRRELKDVEHMLEYPDVEVFVAREDSDLVGFAAVGAYRNEGVHEARVLDLVAPSHEIYHRLVGRIEQRTGEQGFDLVLLVGDRDPGPEWASVKKQAIMWNEFGQKSTTAADENTQLSFYDIL